MMKTVCLSIGLSSALVAGAPATDVEQLLSTMSPEDMQKLIMGKLSDGKPIVAQDILDQAKDMVEENETEHARRELFPLYAVGNKCARRGCSVYHQISSVNPQMSLADDRAVKGPVKTLEMLALNDDLNTVVSSDSMCTRRRAMARAAGLAAGLALSQVNAPGFAAQTKTVKMGSDSGQLVFVPDEISVCKGDSVTWVNNKGGPHNVVFDEENVPSGVDWEKISMDDQLGDEGATFTQKFDVAGTYGYYCQPHRGAGMNAVLNVD